MGYQVGINTPSFFFFLKKHASLPCWCCSCWFPVSLLSRDEIQKMLISSFSFASSIGTDERIGETRGSGERSEWPRRVADPSTPSSLKVHRGVHDCSADAVALAPAAHTLPWDTFASRCCLPQLFHWSAEMRTVVHHVRIEFHFTTFKNVSNKFLLRILQPRSTAE